MRWHRNPFFHTAVLPPSVAPSAAASARPSADLDSATAAASRTTVTNAAAAAAAARASQHVDTAGPSHSRISTDRPRASVDFAPGTASAPTASSPRRAEHAAAPQGLLAEAATRAAAQRHPEHRLSNVPRFSFMSARRREPRIPKLTILEPSDRLTGYQFFYIFIIDGMGAFLLSGGINFAIAYAMYKTINTDLHPIRLFQFPNTLAGDAAVTIFLQCVITWFIELVLVNRDIRSGHIQPIGFISEPSNALLRWFLLLDRQPDSAGSKNNNPVSEDNGTENETIVANDETANASSSSSSTDGNENNNSNAAQNPHTHDENCHCARHEEPYEPGSLRHWMFFLVSQLIRALLVGVVAFFLLWGPAIGIMTAVSDDHRDGDWWFDGSSWAPPVFKLIYGGLLAALTTPPFAAFWLVRCGWALQANERHLVGEA